MGDRQDARVRACARQLQYLYEETMRHENLWQLAYFIGMAAEEAGAEVRRRQARKRGAPDAKVPRRTPELQTA